MPSGGNGAWFGQGNGAWTDHVEPLEPERPPQAAFPLAALPPSMRAAVVEYEEHGQQPIALVASSALATLSLATQHLANVRRDDVLIGPISTNNMVIAESGERKTSADRAMTKPLRDHERARRASLAADAGGHKASAEAHKMRVDAVRKEMRDALKKSKGASTGTFAQLQRQLEDLEKAAPVSPPEYSLFHSDSTAEAVALDIARGWPSSSLWSDEGGMVVGGHSMADDRAMGFIAMLNRFWDGLPFRRRRVTTEAAELEGRRLTCSLMIQPVVMRQLRKVAGGAVRGMGLFARFLITWPDSVIGTRLYRPPAAGTPAVAAYHAELARLISIEPDFPRNEAGEIVDYRLDPPELLLSPAAFEVWREYHDDVERDMAAEHDLEEVRDVASKSADNAMRLGAQFHLLEGGSVDGEIGPEHMADGAAVAAWFLHEALRVFTVVKIDQATEDAIKIAAWLAKARVGKFVSRKDLRQVPCRALRRSKERRNAALEVLARDGLIVPAMRGSTSGLEVHPDIGEAVRPNQGV